MSRGYIEALGKEASAKAIADAKIKVAQAERDSEIGKAPGRQGNVDQRGQRAGRRHTGKKNTAQQQNCPIQFRFAYQAG